MLPLLEKVMLNKLYKLKDNVIFWVFFGLILRYVLGLYTSEARDDQIWIYQALNASYGLGVYHRWDFAYPPVWGYLLGIFAKLFSLIYDPRNFSSNINELYDISLKTLSVSPITPSPGFNFITKTPLFIVDLVIGYIIYKFVSEKSCSKEKSIIAFNLWFMNPLVIYSSAIIGKFESVVCFFTFLSIILLYKKYYFFSGCTLMLGVLTKIFPINLIPLFLIIIFISNKNKITHAISNIFTFSLGSLVSAVLILSPLFLTYTFENCLTATTLRVHTGLIVGGLSPWAVRYLLGYEWIEEWANRNSFLIVNIQEILIILAMFFLLVIIWRNISRPYEKYLWYGTFYILLITFLTMFILNPPYLVWVVPILVVLITQDSDYETLSKSFNKIWQLSFLIILSFVIGQLLNSRLLILLCIGFLVSTILLEEKNLMAVLISIVVSSLIFYFSLRGLEVIFTPLAAFSKVLPMQTIINQTVSFWNWPGLGTRFFRYDLHFISALLGIYGMILGIFISIKKLKEKSL